ncbi:hypothetical protein Tco_0569038 [Tanacetum coccineum]
MRGKGGKIQKQKRKTTEDEGSSNQVTILKMLKLGRVASETIPSIAIIEVARLLGCLFGFPSLSLASLHRTLSVRIPDFPIQRLDVYWLFRICSFGYRIPLEGDEILQVHEERTLGAAKALINVKVDELKLSDISVSKEEHEVHLKLVLESLRKEKLYAKFSKSSVVGDALGRKERVKSRRVRGMILAAQSEAFKQENVLAERLHAIAQRLDKVKDDSTWKNIMRACDIDFDGSYHLSIRCAPFEALYGRKCRSLVLWAEIRGSSLIRPELVQKMIDKVVLVKEKPNAARDHQKSYADKRRRPLEFEEGDQVLLKVSPWKCVVRFGKKGKLAPRYIGPFEILERIGLIAYRLRLPEELIGVHDTFHVSNLKKCLGNANLHVPLNEIKIDKTLHFVEEPVEIMDREVKSLKRSRIPLVKVR